MNMIKLFSFLLLVLFGIFLVVFGGYDDSPGAQGLGFIVVVGGIVGIVKSRKKNSV